MASRHIGGDLTCRKAAFALVRDEVHGLPIPKSIEHVLKDCTYRRQLLYLAAIRRVARCPKLEQQALMVLSAIQL
uniref:Uncharacterized protein n=2 Tax=Oryza sativa subsp. japonica TaxID=39947 RepID=Q8H0A0_ORYSJ|nr:hypothetical protein LOC_Os10g37990 [Oryza sativa Japonica Group]AAP54697.1 hypothetical protein LOC_Os10g37990 [Oryza sativa Japonica Group]